MKRLYLSPTIRFVPMRPRCFTTSPTYDGDTFPNGDVEGLINGFDNDFEEG